MNHGLNIRWRQTAPDRSLVSLALTQLEALQRQWPDTVQCEIVIERAGPLSANLFRVSVGIDFGLVARARGEGAASQVVASDVETALRAAFDGLRGRSIAAAA